MSTFFLAVLMLLASWRIYNNRALLRQLTKKEWQRAAVVYIVAWAAAVIIIFGGAWLVRFLNIESFKWLIAVAFILTGIMASNRIMYYYLPSKLTTRQKQLS